MKAISLVPAAKVVLVACDPIGWLHSAYADTTNWHDDTHAGHALAPQPPLNAFATADLVPLPWSGSGPRPSDAWYNLSRRRALFSYMVQALLELFGGAATSRLFLLHRDTVDPATVGASGVREAYDGLAAFLGIEAFPVDFAFERRNLPKPSAGRTGGGRVLCAPSEAHSLRHYFRWEGSRLAALLTRLGGVVPTRLLRNRTFCDT
eukprot:CAMPEP_0117479746 /NCGR_PEP_ID=MMETSP0784-20121206/12042_1 /TAXON_ID=39447 /ORGANISM="" /LENGTH=205 /DNA_ID=CAMNT_0005274179 /DNA_START=33 /DNA_END=650 /DNA_ORIENTATION=-